MKRLVYNGERYIKSNNFYDVTSQKQRKIDLLHKLGGYTEFERLKHKICQDMYDDISQIGEIDKSKIESIVDSAVSKLHINSNVEFHYNILQAVSWYEDSIEKAEVIIRMSFDYYEVSCSVYFELSDSSNQLYDLVDVVM